MIRPALSPAVPIWLQRRWIGLLLGAGLRARGVAAERVDLRGVPALRLRPAARRPQRAVLYLHGGAYVLGGPGGYAPLASRLAVAAQAEVYLPDYRLAPEHPFPAAADDAMTAYGAVSDQAGMRVALAGDSAGGGLALATAMRIRDARLAAPVALALISPWTDLTLSGASMQGKAASDPMLRQPWLRDSAARYAAGRPLDDPAISPLFGDPAGLPPTLIHVGSDEILLSDAQRLQQRAQAAGVDIRLEQFDRLWHDFQLHAGMLAQADASLAALGQFLGARLG